VNAPFAWQSNFTGAGIGVALIDSGVSNHPDLYQGILPLSRVVYQQSFVPGNSSANDQFGHGTHVAGLIAGDGLSSTGPVYTKLFKGIAPGANIINLRVLDQNGAGTDSLVIAAINQAISLKSKYNIRVINLSLGRPVWESYTLDPLCAAVEAAWKAGIVVVVSAGNDGRDHDDLAAPAFQPPAAQRVAHDDERRRKDQERHGGKARRHRADFKESKARKVLAEQAKAARAHAGDGKPESERKQRLDGFRRNSRQRHMQHSGASRSVTPTS